MRIIAACALGLAAITVDACGRDRKVQSGTGGISGTGGASAESGRGGAAGQGGRAGTGGGAGRGGAAGNGAAGNGGAGVGGAAGNGGAGGVAGNAGGGGASGNTGGTGGGGGALSGCAALGMPPTTISGTVYAPNGTLPLSGITVYVPTADPGPLPAGVVVNRCRDPLPGGAVTRAETNETGAFQLVDAPSGSNIKLVITAGKWRKQITVATVAPCRDNALPAADTTLPRTRGEGDMPQIAITTGSADSLECLVRRLGVADSEITTDAQGGRVHLYTDPVPGAQGSDSFQSGFPGGSGPLADATTLWGSASKMMGYDMLIFSCEGSQVPSSKPQAAMDAVKAYADAGGRLFLSHFHNVWISGSIQGGGSQAPAVWPGVAGWSLTLTSNVPATDVVDEVNNPKGSLFAGWLVHVSAAATRGQLPLISLKQTCASVDGAKAERWAYYQDGAEAHPQVFQFTTPNELPLAERRGKVMFADIHADASPGPFPSTCPTGSFTAPEKALAYMLFDLASCVSTGP